MKFYKCKNFNKILDFNLNCVYCNYYYVQFFKNGILNNAKNAAIIGNNGYKELEFCLNDKFYGNQDDFTKQSWRRFVKMQVFL